MIQKVITNNNIFKKYYPEYDVKNKILFLQGKVPMKILLEIKYLRTLYRLDIQDIRIN